MKFKKRYLLFLLIALIVTYFLGPKPDFKPISLSQQAFVMPIGQLDNYLLKKESTIEKIKPENESRIIWADSVRKTKYAIVYLHGFSAGPMEADPVHFELAKRYGCNLYLPRLAGHGINDTMSFLTLQPDDLIDDAKEALDVGKIIGENVILMSCSTGGTLSIYLGANYSDDIAAMLMYSPNVEIYDPSSKLLTGPWGPEIGKMVMGDYNSFVPPPGGEKYWTTKYRIEGVVALQQLLDWTMTEQVFKKVKVPYFLGYYYKSDEISDHIVSIPAMKNFHKLSSTPAGKKEIMAFPDVGNHVMVSEIQADDYTQVQEETYRYLEEVLGMEPVNTSEVN